MSSKQKSFERSSLVGVNWGEDVGIVDIENLGVVFYCYGKIESAHWHRIEMVVQLEDSDFDDPENAIWDEVPALVKKILKGGRSS